MAAKKNPKVQLPKQWTTAQVRVNPAGKVQIKINPSRVRMTEEESILRAYKKLTKRRKHVGKDVYRNPRVRMTQDERILRAYKKLTRRKKHVGKDVYRNPRKRR